ncbi:MAG: hypothetical protein AB7T15_09675 [Desulfuromonas sp.]|jgi:hypothetical protein|nr:hypothetical protein [Desulfuromonas thiophila]MDY0398910.1 hypothetical protein [Desulfuromonas thiophila]
MEKAPQAKECDLLLVGMETVVAGQAAEGCFQQRHCVSSERE